MTAAGIVAARPISEIWVALGGDPPKHGRARAFYRDGDNPQAVSLNDSKAVWYDHRDRNGGGVLDLVQHVLSCDRRAALGWLADFTSLPLEDRAFKPAERREYERRSAQAERLARDVADWERGLELFLLRLQETAAAITTWLLLVDVDPVGLLVSVGRELVMLREADADSLVRTYRGLPDSVRRNFTEEGRRDREHAEAVTRAIVGMLARVERVQPEGTCA